MTGPVAAPLIAQFAVTALEVHHTMAISQAQTMMLADPSIGGLVWQAAGGYAALTRARLDAATAHPPHYGHPPPSRATVGDLPVTPAPVLPADLSAGEAAKAVMQRWTSAPGDDIVVAFPGGGYGVAAVQPLLAYVVDSHAQLGTRDPVTSLGDRRGFHDFAAQTLTGGDRLAALFLLDLDRFKDINDALGHHVGDQLLRHVADALVDAAQGQAPVFRLGDDEFAVIIDDWTRPFPPEVATLPITQRLTWVGQRMLEAVQGPFTLQGVPVRAEGSIGIAFTPEHGTTLELLMRRADAAMSSAKRHRTGVQVWHSEINMAAAADLQIVTELHTAITAGELRLHYQPLVTAADNTVHAVEALVRWQHPTRGLLPPAAFLPQAEQSEVITALTDWVFTEATRQGAAWLGNGTPLPISLNLAAPVMADDRWIDTLTQLLRTHRLPPHLITIEVTESAIMTQPAMAARQLDTIRDLGVKVSIDDFGTGYTSLALLTQLPIDELKLDRAFITRINDRAGLGVIKAVAELAAHLDVTLVGEGIENQTTGERLRDLGFDLLQGFHYGRPQPPTMIRLDTTPRINVDHIPSTTDRTRPSRAPHRQKTR